MAVNEWMVGEGRRIASSHGYYGRIPSILILSVLVLFCHPAMAQQPALNDSWRWKLFTTESGLPSLRVFDVVETKNGTPWANSALGLAWYDGYTWRPAGAGHGLSSHQVASIIPDERDSVLVLENEKLYYGGQHGFREIPVIVGGSAKKVRSAAYFGGGRYLLIINSSLYILSGNDVSPYDAPLNLASATSYHLWRTQGGNVWINCSAGLFSWNGKAWMRKLPPEKINYGLNIVRENINGLAFAFITLPPSHAGLWRWENGSSSPVHESSEGRDNLLGFDVNPDNHGIMVKETDDVKLFENNRWTGISSPPQSLKNVLFVKYRSTGDLWVGTEMGLYLHLKSSRQWTIWRFPIPDQRNNINEIIKRKDGSIWCGTGDGLVIHYPDGPVKTIDKINGNKLGPVTGLAEDAKGRIWVSSGNYFEGVYRLDGSQWEHISRKDGLDAGSVHKIIPDKKGGIWFLGLYRKDFADRKVNAEPGPYYFENETFRRYGAESGLPDARVYSFAEESDGTLWFGTSAGLYRWKPSADGSGAGEWKSWNTENGLRSNRIFTLAIDKENKLWFGDQSNGLGFLENDSPGYYKTADGLVSDAVWNIKTGRDGKLYVATRGGLSIYDKGNWSEFDLRSGIENSRLWALLLADDRVYMGSSGGGIQILDMHELKGKFPIVSLYPPLVQNFSLLMHWRAYSYWGSESPDYIKTRFRIDDQRWSEWNNERNILIPNLSSGSHTFSIQTSNQIGEISDEIKTISFSIPPPLYKMPVFFIPVGIMVLLTTFFGIALMQRKSKNVQTLRKSEEQYRKLFETANDAIIIFDPEDRIIIDVNRRASELYKIGRQEFIRRKIDSLAHDNRYLDEMLGEISKAGRAGKFEISHFNSESSPIYLTTNAASIEYAGKPAVLAIMHDVTEKREAEAQLRLLAQTVASTQDYVSITDLNNKILFVNDAFAKAYGYAAEELFGKQIEIVRPTSEVDSVVGQILNKTMAGGWNGEVDQQKKDGSRFVVELWTSVVYDEDDKPVALVGVARDITERKLMEHEKEKLIKELRDALSEVKALSGLLPICSSCKKIRDDKGYWTQVETYISRHSEAVFTHGLCPDCTKELFPEVYRRLKEKKDPPSY